MTVALPGFVPPFALQHILSALADPSPNARTTAYAFTALMFIANLSFAQVDINQRWFSRRCYERTRGQLFCALHYKALKRRDIGGNVNKGKGRKGEGEEENESADLGKVVNLMQYVRRANSRTSFFNVHFAEEMRMQSRIASGNSRLYSLRQSGSQLPWSSSISELSKSDYLTLLR